MWDEKTIAFTILSLDEARHIFVTDTVARTDNYFAEYRMLFSRCRGNERDIFKIALDGTSLFRGSCIDVIKSRLRKNVKAPASKTIAFTILSLDEARHIFVTNR
jgi:hypothetical protein